MSTKTARRRREVAVDNLDESLQDNWLLNFRIKKPFYFNPNDFFSSFDKEDDS